MPDPSFHSGLVVKIAGEIVHTALGSPVETVLNDPLLLNLIPFALGFGLVGLGVVYCVRKRLSAHRAKKEDGRTKQHS